VSGVGCRVYGMSLGDVGFRVLGVGCRV